MHVEGGELRRPAWPDPSGVERRPEEDRALGEALLASDKDREEHAIVVRALREGLEGCASS